MWDKQNKKIMENCHLGRLEEVRKAVLAVRGDTKRCASLLNYKGQDGNTPLHSAASQGHEAVVKVLVKGGVARLEAYCNNGETPLHKAALAGHERVVQWLVETRAYLEAQDKDEYTPLHKAAYQGHESVVQVLVEARANLEARTSTGDTPLHCAAHEGREAVVRVLVAAGADLSAQNKLGSTPLRSATCKGHDTVAQVLVEAAANLEAQYRRGETAWHNATNTCQIQVLPEAPFKKKGNNFLLQFAPYQGHDRVVKEPIQAGATDARQCDIGENPPQRAGSLVRGRLLFSWCCDGSHDDAEMTI